jgi:hypothetical protein
MYSNAGVMNSPSFNSRVLGFGTKGNDQMKVIHKENMSNQIAKKAK